MTRKNIIWLIVILATTWLTWYAYSDDESTVAQVKLRQGFKQPATLLPTTKEDTIFYLTPRKKQFEAAYDLFAGPVKQVQKSPMMSNIKVLPTAPPLPFKYLGAVTEENQNDVIPKVILEQQGEVLAVKGGDQLGTLYKLVAINKMANNTTLVFLYLPLKITQTMVVSNAEHP